MFKRNTIELRQGDPVLIHIINPVFETDLLPALLARTNSTHIGAKNGPHVFFDFPFVPNISSPPKHFNGSEIKVRGDGVAILNPNRKEWITDPTSIYPYQRAYRIEKISEEQYQEEIKRRTKTI